MIHSEAFRTVPVFVSGQEIPLRRRGLSSLCHFEFVYGARTDPDGHDDADDDGDGNDRDGKNADGNGVPDPDGYADTPTMPP